MGLLDDIIRAAARAVNSNSKEFEELQRKQFDSGKDAKGKTREPYALSTQRYKRRKGQPTNRVTLKDSGDSYREVNVSANMNGVEIDVPTDYFKYMVTKYGEDTIGVEPDKWREYIEKYILPEIANEFTRSYISR